LLKLKIKQVEDFNYDKNVTRCTNGVIVNNQLLTYSMMELKEIKVHDNFKKRNLDSGFFCEGWFWYKWMIKNLPQNSYILKNE
jgi:hypothetical protein